MKKIVFVMQAVVTAMMIGANSTPAIEEEAPKGIDASGTEILLVNEYLDDGYMGADSLDPESNLKYGYVLDTEYNIGDVVEVSFDNDDILSEKLLTGKELEQVEKEYEKEIDAIYDTMEPCQEGYVQTEDYACIMESYFE